MKKSFLSCFSVRKHSQRCSTTTTANTTQKTGCMTHVRSYNAFLNTEKLSQYDRNYNQNIASKTCITVTHENIKSIMGWIDSTNGSAGYYVLEKKKFHKYTRSIYCDWFVRIGWSLKKSSNWCYRVSSSSRENFFDYLHVWSKNSPCHQKVSGHFVSVTMNHPSEIIDLCT